MKKHRGLKRYYKRLSEINDFESGITWPDFKKPDLWFDYWHVHYDDYGYGNTSFKRRKPHLDMLFRHYTIAANIMLQTHSDFQLWIFVNEFTSQDDALYFHTPNPNDSEFPHTYSNLSLECNFKNQELIMYLEELTGFKTLYGEYFTEDKPAERFCALCRDDIGLSIV